MFKLITNSKKNSKRCGLIKNKTNDIHSISTVVGIIFTGSLFGLYGTVYLIDGILPSPLSIADEGKYPDAFITERAQEDLKHLTTVGPRIVGSFENEVLAVKFLLEKITFIQKQAENNQKIEIDLQLVNGSIKQDDTIISYANLQNIAVKLNSEVNSSYSLLINAHFDSAPTSPGGSDDGISCAVMLEIMRKLSRSRETFQHNIIFLFNGAEETGLQAAHGFISQHKWAKEVKVLINLDSTGASGRIMLFQVGPRQPWLLQYYKNIRNPSAQVYIEEIFQSRLIPSDTDFTVFKKFEVVGFDFTFVKDGYRYHTKFDGFSNIPSGSFQHVGDSILILIRNLANAPELLNTHKQPKREIIYYDFLGLFIIFYTDFIAAILYNSTAVLSLTITIKSFYDFGLGFSHHTPTYHIAAFMAILLGWVAAGLVVAIIAFTIDGLDFNMSWYGNSWIILGLYVTPIFTCSSGFIVILNYFTLLKIETNLSISAQAQIQAHLQRLIWTLLLLIGASFSIRSIYLIFVPVLFQTLTFVIIQLSCIQHSNRKWQIVYVLGMIVPTVFLMQQALTLAQLIVPIFSRTGPSTQPELCIGIFALILTFLITSFYTPLIILMRKSYILLIILSSIFVISFIIVITPLGFPYSDNARSAAPQRLAVVYEKHINKTNQCHANEKKSGFRIWYQDRNSPRSVRKFLKDSSSEKLASMIHATDRSIWIPAKELTTENISLKLNSRSSITDSVTRFNFTALGPYQMKIRVFTKPRVTLSALSLQSVEYSANINCTCFNIAFIWGKKQTPLTFSLDFKIPPDLIKYIFTIELTGTYYYTKNHQSITMLRYANLLNQFPTWIEIEASVQMTKIWNY